MNMIEHWISAMRLHTLPLTLSGVGMGGFLAAYHGQFRLNVFVFCILTTLLLQILSNLANDYGDSVHGADSSERHGPQRAVQQGYISLQSMKHAIYLFSLLALASGLCLLYVALGWQVKAFATFLSLGILAIIAAITYTSGPKPYGYVGLGDLSVVLFFGWLAVLGVYFLCTQYLTDFSLFLPATSCGLFAAAVLNVNNIRDIESDRKAGKKSIPVRIGRKWSVAYHWLLLVGGLACALIFTLVHFEDISQLSFLVCIPLIAENGWAVSSIQQPSKLDAYLKRMALISLLFVVSFGVGLVW